jgi:hypothetical protein
MPANGTRIAHAPPRAGVVEEERLHALGDVDREPVGREYRLYGSGIGMRWIGRIVLGSTSVSVLLYVLPSEAAHVPRRSDVLRPGP